MKSKTHPFKESELPDVIAGAKIASARSVGDDFVKDIQRELDQLETQKKPSVQPRPMATARRLF